MNPACHRPSPAPLGTVVGGRYRLTGLLGRGATGMVYRAEDQGGSGQVAIKVGAGEGDRSGWIRRLVHGEAACLMQVRHPRIVRLRGLARVGGDDALILDLLPGETLAALLTARRGVPLGEGAALRIVDDLGGALACLHRAGFVHGDVKPGNVVVAPDGRATLIDFGAARRIGDSAGPASAGENLADVTPAYAAPGLLAGEGPDPRDDVYSLALVALAALTGRPPRGGGGDPGAAAGGGRPTPSTTIAPVRRIVLRRALAADRADRPPRADRFAAQLRNPGLADRLAAWAGAPRLPGRSPTPPRHALS